MALNKAELIIQITTFVLFGLLSTQVFADIQRYDFVVKEKSYTRLCQTKKILTVNGQFPGPTIKALKGDTVIVKVINHGDFNLTIHWHGVYQPRNSWSDGPEYITQCPIRPGASFTYKILLSEEEGTLWWHAHSDWSRATVLGAFIIKPKTGTTYPFPTPHREIPIILGEWWKAKVSDVLAEFLLSGADTAISDAYIINGQPGDLYPCSKNDMFNLEVNYGKTYLLRIINAVMNGEHFFAIAGHKLTVVGIDASYTKPYTVDHIMITPGQTMDILLETKPGPQNPPIDRYYMAARPYSTVTTVPFNINTTTAVLQYKKTDRPPQFPNLPELKNTSAATEFVAGLHSLASVDHPISVPETVDERIVITLAINLLQCPQNNCSGPSGNRLAASISNITFTQPKSDILRAYYEKIAGVFEPDFPSRPPFDFNFTMENPAEELWFSRRGTKAKVLEYGQSVEIVMQGTNLVEGVNHPMHLHGYSFYVVGYGFGNFDEKKDPLTYNLVDPPYQNTVAVPKGGWAAVRFKADNPGVWFMHCHLETHNTWGMDTVFIVKNGPGPNQQLLPPPKYMPPC